jgi:hypothetical protein
VFYGAYIRASGVDWFLNQLRQLAALPASDEGPPQARTGDQCLGR